MRLNFHTWAVLGMYVLVFGSCKETVDPPPNPYDDVDYGGGDTTSFLPDPNGIVGIYQNILSVKCANPGCHDGHFEPDFRSIHSAWSTLAFHPLTKNTADSAYTYRVVPYDTGASVFWYRITRGDDQLQRMPATGNYMTPSELQNVRTWIQNGARDMFGNLPVLPNGEPKVLGFLAYNSNFTQQLDVVNNRLDSVAYMPFKVADNTQFNVVILVEDDSTAVNNLQVNRLKLSLQENGFSGANGVNASFLSFGGFDIWVAPVNTTVYTPGDTVFMRYYVNDGDHAFNTEFPRDDHPSPYKTYAAFYILP